MKKYFKLNLIFLSLILISSIPAYSQTTEDAEILEKISKIGFNKVYSQDPKKEITSIFQNHTNYANTHNLEQLKLLYSNNYLNSDGFEKQTYFEMISKTWELYPAVKYTTVIKDIYIDGDYAIVQVNELACGSTKESFEKIKGSGLIQSDSYTFYYLQRIGKDWKITSNSVISESTSLRYGEAKNTNISLNAPTQVRSGQEYTATLNLNVPSGSFILASISNESISYPQKQPKDVFRNIKRDGLLERVLIANKDHYNEYSVASIGITKTSITGMTNIDISITGMAFLMKRVNVINENSNKQIKIAEDVNLKNDKN